MSRPMSTTAPGMLTAAGHMSDTRAIAQNGVDSVRRELGVLNGTWTGEANAAFDTAMNAWITDCETIVKKLDEMVELMHGNRKTITAGEQDNTHLASKIPTGPGLGI